jgi:hypothetical protein
MTNPHGTCLDCAWHTRTTSTDDGDRWHTWVCWRDSGVPEDRLKTTTDSLPPACESHLRERPKVV